MRWHPVRKAAIDPKLRETFAQYGTLTMQVLLATNQTFFRYEGNLTTVERHLASLLPWLKEQYDREELKETWMITFEFAVTIFVAIEAFGLRPFIISFIKFIFKVVLCPALF